MFFLPFFPMLFLHLGNFFFFNIKKKFFLAAPRSMWDLSSLTGDGTHIPCLGRQS